MTSPSDPNAVPASSLPPSAFPPGAAPAQATPASQSGPHAEPDDREEIYFEGSPPTRAVASKVALYTLIAAAILALAIYLIHEHIGPWWLRLALIALEPAGTETPLDAEVKGLFKALQFSPGYDSPRRFVPALPSGNR